ncbi:MAG TPA: sulfite exporter TauE/SafE family protein [Armatimonadota bacterium]|nr:sulfite exporter TauE/SafE family protein [Armatimonadota bacterium]
MMDVELALLVALIGLGASTLSGLLGIGGGIVMAPALLYLPPLLGVGDLDMRAVAGLTIVQGLAACLVAGIRHNQYEFVSRKLVGVMAPTIMIAAFVGGFLSKHVATDVLLGLFAGLALIAAALMFIPKNEDDAPVLVGETAFSPALAVAIALSIGFLGGMVGQGGSFILIPLMLYALKVPTRVAIGSNLGIVFFSSLAGFVGKAVTGQIMPVLAVGLVVGAFPGALVGSYLSKRTKPGRLRLALAVVIGLAALRMWVDVLS